MGSERSLSNDTFLFWANQEFKYGELIMEKNASP
jgi:hypothetical protein